jgi:hypothetical protein
VPNTCKTVYLCHGCTTAAAMASSRRQKYFFQTLPEVDEELLEDEDEDVPLTAFYLASLEDGRIEELLRGALQDGAQEVGEPIMRTHLVDATVNVGSTSGPQHLGQLIGHRLDVIGILLCGSHHRCSSSGQVQQC